MSRITLVGTGSLATQLGIHWARAGHQITFASHNPQNNQELKNRVAGSQVVGIEEGLRTAEVLVIALPYDSAEPFAQEYAEQLRGKLVIDASNPNGRALIKDRPVVAMNDVTIRSGLWLMGDFPSALPEPIYAIVRSGHRQASQFVQSLAFRPIADGWQKIPGSPKESPLTVETKLQPTIWTKLPLASENAWIAAYGNTCFAYSKVYLEKQNIYGFSGGLHGGLDLGGREGDIVVAGTTGRISKVRHINPSAGITEHDSCVWIHKGSAILVYQHLKDICVEEGREVNENTPLGKLGGEEQHLHLEIRQDGYLHNPLLYFSQELHNKLVKRIDGQGNRAGETFFQIDNNEIPWQTPTTQPIIPQNPDYLILQKHYGVGRMTR
jgi:murein DD-endopeptidase MepM/ murein hydrolase activator NlpD